MSDTLTFTVPGKVASNNRVTRFGGRGAHKNPQAATYQQRVFQYAFAAVKEIGWEMPAACHVRIDLYNVRIDIDNAPKATLDGMSGIVYDDDKRVTKLDIEKFVDLEGERIIVTVEPRQMLEKPKKRRSA